MSRSTAALVFCVAALVGCGADVVDEDVVDEAVVIDEDVDFAVGVAEDDGVAAAHVVEDEEDVVDDDVVVNDDEAVVVDDDEDVDPEIEGFNVRFATYNVRTSNLNNSAWGDTHVGFDGDDAQRMRNVADTIADQNLTVVALQEVRQPERSAIVGRLLDEHQQTWSATTQVSGRDDAVVVYRRSVWRKVRETHFTVPLQPGLDDRSQIGVLLEHRASGERLWFYSVHLAAGPDGESARRVGIRRAIDSIRVHAVDNGRRFVLGGDFNTDAGGAVGDLLRDAGFAKYARSAADRVVGNGCASFNRFAGSAGDQSCPGGTARHIDQVWLSSGGINVVRYQVTASAHTSRSSDHNPLTTILRHR